MCVLILTLPNFFKFSINTLKTDRFGSDLVTSILAIDNPINIDYLIHCKIISAIAWNLIVYNVVMVTGPIEKHPLEPAHTPQN